MADRKGRRFYIGGRYYSPDNATLLCRNKGIFGTVALYRSQKGAFFTVTESIIDGEAETAELLTEAAARLFIDGRATEITPEQYTKIWGGVEKG